MTDPIVGKWAAKPPALVNALTKVILRTPILQSVIGRALALLSFTGRRTQRRYTIPISYERRDGRVLILSKKIRPWWRNFEDQPEVELRLAGKIVPGRAEAHVATEDDLDEVVAFLANRPQDVNAYGVARLADGSLDPESMRVLLPRIVLIHINLN